MGDQGYSSFQKSPIRGRPNVSKLVPKKLTRSTTDDSQTAINRVVHEALARGGTVSSPEVAEEVQQRVALVLQAKEDELTGKITHQQRLQLIKLVATLSAEEYFEEARRLQSSARQDAEQKVNKSSSMMPVLWRRMLCSCFLGQEEVLGLGACCRFLRQDHALGLQSFVLPSHLEGLEDTVTTARLAMKPLPLPALKRLVSKFRYAQKLVCSTRCCRLQDSDLELLPLAQLRVLDLSFCYNLSEEKLLEGLRSTLCLSDLSLRGCSQLTSPGTEEALADLKGLISLDVRGCSNLSSESMMRLTAENLKQLTTLRFGYTCTPQLWPEHQAMPCETFSSETFAGLGSSRSLQCLELDIGLMHRWAERGGAPVVDDAIVSLLCLKHLQALMLWNCKDLQPMTFRRILDRLGEGIDTVSIDDCYHDYDAYFHVVPSVWGIRTAQELDKGVRSEAMLPPSSPTAGRAVLIGHNVARDREAVLAKTVQPLVDKGCQPTSLVLQCEGDYDGVIQLASDRTEQIELLTSINISDDFLENFFCSMLKRCSLLRKLGIRTKGAMMSPGQLRGYEAVLKVVSAHCQQLEVFDTWLMTSFDSLSSRHIAVAVEYYDRNPPKASSPAVHYDTLRDFFGSCPLLTTVRLVPPSAGQDRVAFWRFCSDAGFPQSSLILGDSPPRNLPRPAVEVEPEELQILRQVDAAPVTELAILKGCPLTTAMAGEILRFTQLRRLGLQQMNNWPVLRELLLALAEHCPDVEELSLSDVTVSEGEVFLEALQRFRLRSLSIRKLVPESVEQMVVQALPGLVQLNRRTLQSLACSGDLGSSVLCSLASRAPHLRSLIVSTSLAKQNGEDKEVCKDFAGSQEELLLKLVARRPKLEELEIAWVRQPDDKLSKEQERRTLSQVLHHAPNLMYLGCTDISFYTGLQYNDGHEFTTPPASESDDSD